MQEFSKCVMSIFSIFKLGQKPSRPRTQSRMEFEPDPAAEAELAEQAKKWDEDFLKNDYLGKAAMAGHEARQAVKAKRFDDAWRLYHEKKSCYLKQASRLKFTREQTLQLDASVSEDLANVLRLEGKHDQALVHILYWVAWTLEPLKRHNSKLKAYFNRCKFTNTTVGEAETYVRAAKRDCDLEMIQRQVAAWRGREGG